MRLHSLWSFAWLLVAYGCGSCSSGPSETQDSRDDLTTRESVSTSDSPESVGQEISADVPLEAWTDERSDEEAGPVDVPGRDELAHDHREEPPDDDVAVDSRDEVSGIDAAPEIIQVDPSPVYSPGQSLGIVEAPEINEASGMAASLANPGVLWVHNDSGDSARFSAINLQGELLGQFSLEGITAVDWEDMAAGPGPEPGVRYLYLGDIGDNSKHRPFVTVHRVREPTLPAGETPFSAVISDVHSFQLQYPEGTAYDCETLMVDPLDGTVVLVIKVFGLSFKSTMFSVTLPTQPPAEPLALTHLADISISLPTAGDVSPDGTRWLLRNYNKAYLWLRPLGSEGAPGSLVETFSGERFEVPIAAEPQGETVAFAADGSGYYSLSEGIGQPLYFYAKQH